MLRTLLLTSATLAFATMSGFTQDISDIEEEEALQTVVVTGSLRVTQGGAQDIGFFRGAAEDLMGLPAAETITSEGLLSDHDLQLAEPAPCAQTFCLSAEAMPISMVTRPEATSLIGLGFGTNLTEDSFKREPVTIVAVVDKSGSMGGYPLELAKQAMLLTLDNLKSGDRMAVVQYGSTTDLVIGVSDVAADRQKIRKAIEGIYSSGSTAMEAGLELGFETALKAQDGFDGKTRLMLYTDERPNVGNTDKDSFIGMAVAGSERGIGLTTIGVANHFGAELANQVSAARGGNLFYLQDTADAEQLFSEQFDFLMTEVAHDLSVSFTPQSGQTIEAIYGVPGEMIETDETGLRFTIPTVFLSNKAGGVFVALSGETKEPAIDISMSYKGVIGPDGGDNLSVTTLNKRPSIGLRRAALLVDEYEVLKQAATAYENEEGDETQKALADVQAVRKKLKTASRLGLRDEIKLLNSIEANLQIALGMDFNKDAIPPQARLHGEWRVKSVEDQSDSLIKVAQNMFDRGDTFDFDLEDTSWQSVEVDRNRPRGKYEDYDEEDIQLNEDQILFLDSERVFEYDFEKDDLIMRMMGSELVIVLERTDDANS